MESQFLLAEKGADEIPGRFPPLLAAGAVVRFEGRVRNHNEGREVRSLEYSSYPVLAVKEGQKIVAEALEKFPVLVIRAIHFYGPLDLGDVALVVEAAAAHRQEAFEACLWTVDQIKARVPIWKKEQFA